MRPHLFYLNAFRCSRAMARFPALASSDALQLRWRMSLSSQPGRFVLYLAISAVGQKLHYVFSQPAMSDTHLETFRQPRYATANPFSDRRFSSTEYSRQICNVDHFGIFAHSVLQGFLSTYHGCSFSRARPCLMCPAFSPIVSRAPRTLLPDSVLP